VQVIPAGDQLKLQLLISARRSDTAEQIGFTMKSLGQMLMFQPETGNISLNLSDEAFVSSNWWQTYRAATSTRRSADYFSCHGCQRENWEAGEQD